MGTFDERLSAILVEYILYLESLKISKSRTLPYVFLRTGFNGLYIEFPEKLYRKHQLYVFHGIETKLVSKFSQEVEKIIDDFHLIEEDIFEFNIWKDISHLEKYFPLCVTILEWYYTGFSRDFLKQKLHKYAYLPMYRFLVWVSLTSPWKWKILWDDTDDIFLSSMQESFALDNSYLHSLSWQAIYFYTNHQYDTAISFFEKAIEKNQWNQNIACYLALALIKSKKNQNIIKGINILKDISSDLGSPQWIQKIIQV